MLIRPSFKKSLIVEQFQGNYLNFSMKPSPGRVSEAGLKGNALDTRNLRSLVLWESNKCINKLQKNWDQLVALTNSRFCVIVCRSEGGGYLSEFMKEPITSSTVNLWDASR